MSCIPIIATIDTRNSICCSTFIESSASPRVAHRKLDRVHHYMQLSRSTDKSGEVTGRRRRCSRFVLRVIFKVKGISKRGPDARGERGVCKRRDRAAKGKKRRERGGREREIEREGERKLGLVGGADCGKIAFPHYDEIKVPSPHCSSALFLRRYPWTDFVHKKRN